MQCNASPSNDMTEHKVDCNQMFFCCCFSVPKPVHIYFFLSVSSVEKPSLMSGSGGKQKRCIFFCFSFLPFLVACLADDRGNISSSMDFYFYFFPFRRYGPGVTLDLPLRC